MLSSANIQNIFDTSKKDNNRRVGDYVVSLHDPHFCARGTVLNSKESLRFAQTSFYLRNPKKRIKTNFVYLYLKL